MKNLDRRTDMRKADGSREESPPAPKPGQGATEAQLKDDIDSGETADKVAFPDPGASPLGTDAEAGGAPSSPGEMELAREQGTARGPDEPERSVEDRHVSLNQKRT